MPKNIHIIIAATISLALAACNTPMSSYPNPTADELAAEERVQHEMLSAFAAKGGAPRPWRKNGMSRKRFDRVADRIEKSGAKVCQEIGLPNYDMRCYFYFKTSSGDDINAYADGEKIVVYSGMRRFVKNDDELALVMAHEFTHNLMGHIAAAQNNALLGALVGAAAEGASGSSGLTSDVSYLASVAYSPSFEHEADYIGMYVLARAGYNPEQAIQFWRRFTVESPDGTYASVTHPSNPARFAALKKTIAEINQKRKTGKPLLPNMSQAFYDGQH